MNDIEKPQTTASVREMIRKVRERAECLAESPMLDFFELARDWAKDVEGAPVTSSVAFRVAMSPTVYTPGFAPRLVRAYFVLDGVRYEATRFAGGDVEIYDCSSSDGIPHFLGYAKDLWSRFELSWWAQQVNEAARTSDFMAHVHAHNERVKEKLSQRA